MIFVTDTSEIEKHRVVRNERIGKDIQHKY